MDYAKAWVDAEADKSTKAVTGPVDGKWDSIV